MPDLSASLDVELQRIPDALVAPRDAVITAGKDHFVMAADGSGFSRKEIQLRAESDIDAAIAGIPEGTSVLNGVNR
jgi:microcompartment protein CcmK/EutM